MNPSDLLLITRAAVDAALLFGGLFLIGYTLLPLRWRSFDPVLLSAQSLALGISAISLLVWVLSSLVGTRWVLPVLGLLLLPALLRIRSALRLVVLALKRLRVRMLVFLLPAFIVSLPALLLPIIDSDGLRYHLALPKLFLMTGKVFFYPWDSAGAYPQSAEMLDMLALQLGAPGAAKWMHFGIVLIGAALLVLFLRRRSGGGPAAWAYLAIPVVLAGASAAFIDGFVVFHLAVALLLIERRSSPWAVGLALAGAAWTKYTAFPGIVGLVIFSVFRSPHAAPFRKLPALCLPALLVLSPLAIRNIVATGDPFFPIIGSILGREQPGIDRSVDQIISKRHGDIPGPLGIPWGRSLGSVEVDEIIGWHLLPGLLLLPLFWRDRRIPGIAAMSLPYFILGFWFHPSMRLVMPFLWGLAALSGLALEMFGRRLGRRAETGMAILLMLGSLPYYGQGKESAWGVFMPWLGGHLSRGDIVEQLVPGAMAAEWINRQVLPGKVMALDYPAPFLFDRPWLAEGLSNRPPLAIWMDECPDGGALLEKLREEKVRFILVTPGYGGGRLQSLLPLASTPEQEKILVDLRSRLSLRYRRDGVDIWELPKGDTPGRPDASASVPAPR